jgi:hypothetical protein
MEKENQPTDPFTDFINTSLNMEGIDGLDQAVMADKVRGILRGLPANVSAELWNERLDDLQGIIRVCLDLDTVLGAFDEKLDPVSFTRDDLEILIMLSVTFAFISYNQLRPAYSGQGCDTDNLLLARRMRDTLQVTLGWVKRAAREGDPIAARLTEEVYALLNTAKRLDAE